MKQTLINHLINLGWEVKYYRDQPAYEKTIGSIQWVYYIHDDKLEVFDLQKRFDLDVFTIDLPQTIDEITEHMMNTEIAIKALLQPDKPKKIGYMIKKSSSIYKYLNFLEKAYSGNYKLINRDNGCPVFWGMIFLTLCLPLYYMFVIPIMLLVIVPIESLEYDNHKKAIISYIGGGIWACITIPLLIKGISLITEVFSITTENVNVLEVIKGFFTVFGLITLVIVFIVILFYTAGFILKLYIERKNTRNRKLDQKKLHDPEFKTTGEFIKTFALSFYEKHCPKLNWEDDDE